MPPFQRRSVGFARAAVSLAALLLATTRPTPGQTTPAPPAAHKPATVARPVQPAGMTNQDVIDLLKAGFSEDFVVGKITSTKNKAFDVSTKGLVQLKTAGVSERVIDAVLGIPDKPATDIRPAAPAVAPATATVASKKAEPAHGEAEHAPAGSVAAIHDPGIYVSIAGKFVAIESHPATDVGVTGGSMWANRLSMGIASAKVRASVPGAKADLRLPPLPEFYFSGTTFRPPDYLLVELTTGKDNRSIQIGHAGGASASIKTAVDKDAIVTVIVTKLDNGVSKVTIEPPPLDGGEYAFVNVADDKSKEFWDFGVDEVTPPKSQAR